MSTHQTLHYGAIDLKESYNRNLGMALILSIVIHLLAIGAYIIFAKTEPVRERLIADNGPRCDYFPEPREQGTEPKSDDESGGTGGANDPISGPGDGGPTTDLGTPIPAELDTLPSRPVNMVTNIPIGDGRDTSGSGGGGSNSPNNGNNGGEGRDTSGKGSGNAPVTREPVDLDLVFIEEEPTFDAAELQRNLKYPELARRNNIEGMVIVKVLIDEHGRPVRTVIERSDAKTLETAAVSAVMRTTFTPAIQNEIPVSVWMKVPVTFTLQ